jgi:hypothetical protein
MNIGTGAPSLIGREEHTSMRAIPTLLMLCVGCTGVAPKTSRPGSARPRAESAAAGTTSAPAWQPATSVSAATLTAQSVAPAGHFRIAHATKGWFIELAEGGEVTSNRFHPATLGEGGQLVVHGVDSVYRVSANGDVLEDDVAFGRFVDDATLTFAHGPAHTTLAVSPDGSVSVTQKIAKKVAVDTTHLHVEANSGSERKLALFVLACEWLASSPLRPRRVEGPPEPLTEAEQELLSIAGFAVVGGILVVESVVAAKQPKTPATPKKP